MKTKTIFLSFVSISALTVFLHAETISGTVTKVTHTDVAAGDTLTYEITDGSMLIFENITYGGNGAVMSVGAGSTFVAGPDNAGGTGQVIFRNNISSGASGGAIYNQGGTVTVENALFDTNISVSAGGGIANFEGVLNITNATFQNNKSNAWMGGAILNSVNAGRTSTAVITDSSFFGNSAVIGGAICNNSASLSVFSVNKDVEFSGNADTMVGRANAIESAEGTLYLVADSGRQILFRDTVTTSFSGLSNEVYINSKDGTSTGKTTGRVTFSGQDFAAGSNDVKSTIEARTTVYGGTLEIRDAAEFGVNATGTTLNVNNGAVLSSTASKSGVINILAAESFTLEEGAKISVQDATTLEIQNTNLQLNGGVSLEFVMNESSTEGLGLLSFSDGALDLITSTLIIDVSLLDLSDEFWKSSWETEILTLNSGILSGDFANIETNATGGTFTTEIDGGSLKLIWASSIPEPSSYAMILGLGSLGMLASRRRRK